MGGRSCGAAIVTDLGHPNEPNCVARTPPNTNIHYKSSTLIATPDTDLPFPRSNVEALEVAASARGVDYRERLLTDLSESLRDNDAHEVLER